MYYQIEASIVRSLLQASLVLAFCSGLLAQSPEDFPPTDPAFVPAPFEDVPDCLSRLFEKLKTGPRLQPSIQRRDLEDLFRPNPDKPGEYIRRNGIVVHDLETQQDPDPAADQSVETLNIHNDPANKRFFIEYQFDWIEKSRHYFFGPYEGNVYDLLPEIEQKMMYTLRQTDFEDPKSFNGAIVQLRKMVQSNDPDVANRALSLVEKGMRTRSGINTENRMNRSFQSVIHAGGDKLKSIADKRKLASVNDYFAAYFAKIDAMRSEVPEAEYKIAEQATKEATKEVPKEIAETLWGPVVNGLRLAIVPDKQSIALNEICTIKTIVQNVSDQVIKFGHFTSDQVTFPKIELNHGRTRGRSQTTQPPLLMDGPPTRYLLKPGEQIVVDQSTLTWIPEPKGQFPRMGIGEKRILLREETLQIDVKVQATLSMSFALRDHWNRRKDGKLEIILPAKDEWSGSLSAAGFEISLDTK